MDELLAFLFEGLPVRGALVRLGPGWRDLLARRASPHDGAHAFAPPLRELLGEMSAAACLMQSNIKFNGALVLQIAGDGPVPLAVAEVQPDLAYRATAKVTGTVRPEDTLLDMVNRGGAGRCAITLDPLDRLPGQQPYQGVVSLAGGDGQPLPRLSAVLEQYMRQSEQVDTRMVLAASDEHAAGVLVQRLPGTGGRSSAMADDAMAHEAFTRIAMLAATLSRDELLQHAPVVLMKRLFWQETLRVFAPRNPRFECRCSRERVRGMLLGLGADEVHGIVAELGSVEVGCDFCGRQYRFDAVDVGEMFAPGRDQPPGSTGVH